MFDTHCHLNFKRFEDNLTQVITDANTAGVSHIVVPGTDVATSQKAVEIAEKYETIYAAVGIHPHHVFEHIAKRETLNVKREIEVLETLLTHEKVVAMGEIGMDWHSYGKTRHENYAVSDEFVRVQKLFLEEQIKLAITHKKSIIFHNREAKEDILPIVSKLWDERLRGRSVFHCCEPDEDLLTFANEHKMYLGVDGDITYSPAKQEFIKKVPLEMLVLETDAPFLLPEPLRSEKKFPNEPKNIPLIAEFIARLLHISTEKLGTITTENAKNLFRTA